MKDSVVRGRLLQLLYDRREEGPLPFGAAEGAIPPSPGIDDRAWHHALAQLVEYKLVSWQPLKDSAVSGAMSGLAEITESGVDVRDGRRPSDIDIRFC
jgi:hypothetical protein